MEIVAVSDEPEDTMEIIADYKAELGLSFPMGLSADVADAVPIDGYPTTVVIGKDGRVGYFQLGSFVSEAQFRGIVDYFLLRVVMEIPLPHQNARGQAPDRRDLHYDTEDKGNDLPRHTSRKILHHSRPFPILYPWPKITFT